MNVIDGLKIRDYIVSIENIVGPENVNLCLSNNGIWYYLQNKELVDKIINEYKSVHIEEHEINIRRLIAPAKRLILLNVCPQIFHNIIEQPIPPSRYSRL